VLDGLAGISIASRRQQSHVLSRVGRRETGKVQNGFHKPGVQGDYALIRQGKFRSQLVNSLAHSNHRVKPSNEITSAGHDFKAGKNAPEWLPIPAKFG
jgi:hypothetical protein